MKVGTVRRINRLSNIDIPYHGGIIFAAQRHFYSKASGASGRDLHKPVCESDPDRAEFPIRSERQFSRHYGKSKIRHNSEGSILCPGKVFRVQAEALVLKC